MQARPVGEHALLIECASSEDVAATFATLRELRDTVGATEIVPAARTVLLDGLADVSAARALVATLEPSVVEQATAREVQVPVTYDGPDLAEVARQWAVDPDEVVRIHLGTAFTVAFCGFAPGFAYCTGLPEELAVRRRSEPRSRVPAGSSALAGEFTSAYPRASPGGWQLIGRTDVALWRPDLEEPALLVPGTRVRFLDASSLGSSTQGFVDA
jgi:KipI family sensor histidine kinase inhibitor